VNRSQPIPHYYIENIDDKQAIMGMPHAGSVLITISTDLLKTNGTQLVDILYSLCARIIVRADAIFHHKNNKLLFVKYFRTPCVQCKRARI